MSKRDSSICATWLTDQNSITPHYMCVPWLCVCDMTHLHDVVICVTLLIPMAFSFLQFCVIVTMNDIMTFICVTWLMTRPCHRDDIHMCDIDIHVCDIDIHMCDIDIHRCDIDIHMCDMTHDAFMCVTWLPDQNSISIHLCDIDIHMCDIDIHMSCISILALPTCAGMIHSYDSFVWHDPFICVTWLIHMCDLTHPCVWSV